MTQKLPDMKEKLLDSIIVRLIVLEARQKTLQEELEELKGLLQSLSNRVGQTIWVAESAVTILSALRAPLRKGVEIAIGAAIIYIVTHIRIKL